MNGWTENRQRAGAGLCGACSTVCSSSLRLLRTNFGGRMRLFLRFLVCGSMRAVPNEARDRLVVVVSSHASHYSLFVKRAVNTGKPREARLPRFEPLQKHTPRTQTLCRKVNSFSFYLLPTSRLTDVQQCCESPFIVVFPKTREGRES